MMKALRALTLCAVMASAGAARATPRTTFWTPATTYVQPYLVPHLTYDTYVTERSLFQNDYGITVGVLPFEKLQAEVGIDSFMPGLTRNNLYLNGKLGMPEGALGAGMPGISAGIFGVGFKSDVSDYNILHAELGKALPAIGTLTAGGYYGLNDKLLVSSTGVKHQAGLLAAWSSPDINVKLPGLDKIVLAADLQTGKNAFGAVGGGVYFYFTPAVDILVGPVYFFDKNATAQSVAVGATKSDVLWTVQLDVDFDLRPAKPAPKS